MLRDSAAGGLFDADALSMLEGVLEVADLQVRDIMVPHNQMICVRSDAQPGQILSIAIDSGHSRFPVQDPDGEKIVGILLAKDLLNLFAHNRVGAFDIREWMRKPLFVPESKRVNVLLKDMRVGRNHMAIAVDEYGSVAGLVTIEDVIEQIVGEIDDEYDIEDEKNIRREGDRQFLVRGRTRIGEFNEFFNAGFSDEADRYRGRPDYPAFRPAAAPWRDRRARGLRVPRMRADRRRVETVRVTTPEAMRRRRQHRRRRAKWLIRPLRAGGAAWLRRLAARAAALLAGAALTAAFAPHDLWWLALLSPAAAAALACRAPRRARARCWGSGSASDCIPAGTWWLYISIRVFGQAPVWVALLVMAALVLIMSAYQAGLGYVVVRWLAPRTAAGAMLLVPAAWVFVEWWRSWFLSGFPWLSLGYSQTDTWLAGLAPLGGVHAAQSARC